MSFLSPLLRIYTTHIYIMGILSITFYTLVVFLVPSYIHAQLTLLPKTLDSLIIKLSVASDGSLYALGATDRRIFFTSGAQFNIIPQLAPCSVLYRSVDTARSWKAVPLPKEMASLAILKHRNNTLYLAGYSSSATLRTLGTPLLAISDDGGTNWVTRPIVSTFATVDIAVTSTGAIIAAVNNLVEPLRSTLFVNRSDSLRTPVKSAQILRSLDNGRTWQELLRYSTVASVFSLDANANGIIVAATETPRAIGFAALPEFRGGGEVLSSFDNGTSWQRTLLQETYRGFTIAIYQVNIVPSSATIAVMDDDFMRYFTSNTTNQLTEIGNPLKIAASWSFAVHPSLPRTYFFRDSAFVEQNTQNQMTSLFIKQPYLYNPISMVVLGDDVYGIFGPSTMGRISRDAITSVLSPQVNTDFSLQGIAPNPTEQSSMLTLSLATPARVHYEVLDILGRVLAVSPEEERSAGEQQFLLNVENIPSGVYAVRLTVRSAAGTRAETRRLVVAK